MPEKLSIFILVIILTISFILRVSGINYGLPLHLHPDEWSQVEPPLKMFNWDLNPHVFYYGSFLIYFFFVIFKTLNALIPTVFEITASKSIFYLTGRFISVIFGASTVLLVYLLGKRLFGEKAGLLSAFFFSISPIHVRSSHYAIVDIPLTLFICATIYFCIAMLEENSLKSFILAGVMGGVASSTKYTALLLIAIIYGAFLIKEYSGIEKIHYNSKREKRGFYLVLILGIFFLGISLVLTSSQALKIFAESFSYDGRIEKGDLGYYSIEKIKFIFFGAGIIFLSFSPLIKYLTPFRKLIYINYLNKKIIYSVLIFLIIFLIISPYIFLDFNSFFRDFKFALKVTSFGFYEDKLWTSTEFQSSLISNLRTLISGYGLIFFILFILGIITYFDKKNITPLFWIAVYFLMISRWKLSMSRFLLPILPFMAIYAAGFIFFIRGKVCLLLRENKNMREVFRERSEKLITLFLIILCSAIPFKNSIATVKTFYEGSTLLEGFHWVEKNIREKSKIVLIGETPDLRLSDRDYLILQQSSLKENIGFDYLKKKHIDYLVIGVYKYKEAELISSLRSRIYLRLINEIRPDEFRKGPIIKIYEVKML